MKKKVFSQERLKELLDYNPDTGIFTRKIKLPQAKGYEIGDAAGNSTLNGYLQAMIDGKMRLLSKLAWLYVHGEYPAFPVYHKNKNPADNRIDNLTSLHPHNRTGYRGVYLDKKTNKWEARAFIAGKNQYVGVFETPEIAADMIRKYKENL